MRARFRNPRHVQRIGANFLFIIIVGILVGFLVAHLAETYLTFNPYKLYIVGGAAGIIAGIVVTVFTRKRTSIYY